MNGYEVGYLCAYFAENQELVIERLANAFMFISAVLVSASPYFAVQPWTFVGFLLGHIIWIITAFRMKKKTLAEANIGFLLLDIWAIAVRL